MPVVSPCAAAAGIVLRVGDHHRPLRLGAYCHRLLHRFVGSQQRLGEYLLHPHDVAHEFVGGRVDRRLRIAVRDDGGTAVVQIGWWKARAIAEIEHVTAFACRGLRDYPLRRLDQRALEIERDQEWQLTERACGGLAALKNGRQNARGAAAGLRPVDVRISVVDRHAVGASCHRRREIGVVVEADYDRHIRPYRRAHAAQYLAFAVLEIDRAHCTVQIEIDGVDRQRQRQTADQLADDALERVARDVTPGTAARPHERHQFVLGRHIGDEARHAEGFVRQVAQHFVAARQRRTVAYGSEIVKVGVDRDKAIRFVMKTADSDARHIYSSLMLAARAILSMSSASFFATCSICSGVLTTTSDPTILTNCSRNSGVDIDLAIASASAPMISRGVRAGTTIA
jgi:hypothetical protein